MSAAAAVARPGVRYRKQGRSGRHELTLPLETGEYQALRLLFQFFGRFPGNTAIFNESLFAADMLRVCIAERMPDVCGGMTFGEFLHRTEQGERFEWFRLKSGDLQLRALPAGTVGGVQ